VVLVDNKGLVLVITNMIKLEILGHVCLCFSSIHQVHRVFDEQDETVWRHLAGFKSDKSALSLNCRNLNKRKDNNASELKTKVFRQILYIHSL